MLATQVPTTLPLPARVLILLLSFLSSVAESSRPCVAPLTKLIHDLVLMVATSGAPEELAPTAFNLPSHETQWSQSSWWNHQTHR
jgi:hypothetical protein